MKNKKVSFLSMLLAVSVAGTTMPMYGFQVKASDESLYQNEDSQKKEDNAGAYDPGLPNMDLLEGEDVYQQKLVGGQSTLEKDGATVPAIVANETPFGMEDKAISMKLTQGNDERIKLTDFENGPADGSYEFAFRTGAKMDFSTLGFLVRYQDESKYVGLSIDDYGATWTMHAATGLSTRQNTKFPSQFEKLQGNTTYKVKLSFVGDQVSLQVMKEGDEAYTDLGTVKSQGHVEGGAFAVRLRPKSQTADFFMDNITQYDKDGNVVKKLDFNDGAVPNFEVRTNKNNTVKQNATLEIQAGYPTEEKIPGITPGAVSKITESGIYIDSTSPITDFHHVTMQMKGSTSQYGIVFNYADAENYATIQYDGSKWIAGGKKEGQDVEIDLSAKNIPAIAPEDTRTVRLLQENGSYKLQISGGVNTQENAYETYELGSLEGIYKGAGKVGVVAAEPMTLYVGAVSVVYGLKAVEFPIPTEGVVALESDEMKVLVGDTFPHIYTYLNTKDEYLTGTGLVQGEENTDMNILTDAGEVVCKTTSKLLKQEGAKAVYEIAAKGEGVEAVLTVSLQVSGKTLEFHVDSVDVKSGKVRAFSFADLPMTAVAGRGAGAAMGVVNGWGPANDVFVELKTAATEEEYNNMTYALFYDKLSGVVAAVENNAENGEGKYVVKQDPNTPSLKVSNTAWAWDYYENSQPEKNLPFAKVVIGGDENQDQEITWQDAGIAYREIMNKAFGSENTKNEWMYIAMNMSNGASQPFLRVLDEAKSISYLTDGFGMKVMNKGYQAGGHDDSHGDYDFVGTQQGGVKDFNTLIDEGLKYGIKNGVHINATEFALDGFETEEENLTKKDGELVGAWGWFDKAFNVNKSAEIQNGDLERRLDEFEEIVPNLDFFYVDVYQSGSNFNATEFVRYMNENGASVGTEALGDFNQQINFVHWNTDMYYSTGGNQSEILKFVTHGAGDLAAPDRAMLGSLMPGVADWRNVNDFDEAERVFYRNNLPTKYLQHFELQKWTPDKEAVFSDGVRTEVKDNYTYIYKNDKLLAKIDTSSVQNYHEKSGNPASPKSSEIFIPWSPEVEDKIYCYNDVQGTCTWDVPDSWENAGKAYLYQLTENGRYFVQEVPVEAGKVTLDLELSTPYILVKEKADQAHRYNADGSVMKENGNTVMLPTVEESKWGYGSAIENFGFSGKTFDGWEKSVTKGDKEQISIDTTIKGTKGNPRVMFGEEVAGEISQTVKVEPGKTYSFSAWTMAEGMRSPKLTVKAGKMVKEASVETTAGIPIKVKPSKYTGMNYQRLKVNVTIPDNVKEAEISFSVKDGEQPVYVDDFRCWEWLTAPNPEADDYYYYEDFENVDENWGPFISQVGGQPYIHLAYKNPDGNQMKYYTLDNPDGTEDKDNLVSLKGRQTGAGVFMRTLPSTLDFKQGKKYAVKIDHATYLEQVDAEEGKHVGYNYPLEKSFYTIDVRKANGEIIKSYPLEPSKITGDGFNARPSTETVEFEVDATNEKGIYLTFSRNEDGKDDGRATFVLDNVRVEEVAEEVSVNKSDLQALISYTTAQTEKEDYDKVVAAVREALERELAEAIAVNENPEASQAEVNAAYEELLAIVQMLEFKGDATDLKLSVTLAKAMDTEGKTEESVAVLNAAIKAAEAVLANENALQDEIDKALKDLNAAVEGLEDKPSVTVDKKKLKELLDESKKYENRIDEYTEATANAFLTALTGAKEVYANQDATQEEVNQAYVTLRQAIFGLREIPSKEKLEELIKKAEKIDLSKYTEESAQAVRTALAQAKAVKDNRNATESAVKETEKMLQTAMNGLQARTDNSTMPNNNEENKKGENPVKTEDDMQPVLPMAATLAAILAILFAKRKK